MQNKYTFKKQFAIVLFLLLSVMWCQNSYAHITPGMKGDFTAGFFHPITGLDHILAMLSVGIWGAVLGRPALWLLPVAFPLIMSVGAVWGILGLPLNYVEQAIDVSVIVLGLVIALNFKPPLAVAFFIVSFFAFFHGYAHGHEMPGYANAIGFSSGFVVATGLLHLCGIGIGCVRQIPQGEKILKTVGAGITGTGMFLLFQLIKG